MRIEHSRIQEFTLRFGLESVLAGIADVGVNKKMIALAEHVIRNPTAIGPRGANLAYEIIEYALQERLKPRGYSLDYLEPQDVIPELTHSLELDGFRIEGDRLRPVSPPELDLVDVESRLEQLLSHYAFNVAKGHLEQARAAYVRGEWAAANGQLRTFVEALFIGMAQKLGGTYTSGSDAMAFLAALPNPVIDSNLNEWAGHGVGFMNGFWKRLHPMGSHPGLSDEMDSTFRLRLVVVVTGHYLESYHRLYP